jgi:hypothetical protein
MLKAASPARTGEAALFFLQENERLICKAVPDFLTPFSMLFSISLDI